MLPATPLDIASEHAEWDDNGELRDTTNDALHKLQTKVDGLERALEAIKDENVKLMVANRALRTSNENKRHKHRHRQCIERVHVMWQEITGHDKRALTDDRFDVINKCLNTYAPHAKTPSDPEILAAMDGIRVACLGAVHNNPWRDSPRARKEGPPTEIAVFCKNSWFEQFHDAGCDWLERNGHRFPQRFSGTSGVISQAAEYFNKANQAFVIDPDGKGATALCPVSVEEMRVEIQGTRARFVCPSGCDRDIIVAALKLKQGRGGH